MTQKTLYSPDKYSAYPGQYMASSLTLEKLLDELQQPPAHTKMQLQKYLINKEILDIMKPGVVLINTTSGEALANSKTGYLGLDVYEREKGIFFYDHSKQKIKDNVLKKLMSHPAPDYENMQQNNLITK